MVSADSGEKTTLFYHILSQPSRSAMTILDIVGKPYETRMVDLLRREQDTPEMVKLNPSKTVPAINEVNGNDVFHLSESGAIMRYLVEKNNLPDHWYPKDFKKRAAVNRYMDAHTSEVRAKLTGYFGRKVMYPMQGIQVPPEELKLWEGKMHDALGALNKKLTTQTWIAGTDEISIADIACQNEVAQLFLT